MGAILIAGAAIQRMRSPNPFVNLAFLAKRNTFLLAGGLFTLRFVLLGILVVLPGYLGAVQGFRPLQTGAVLLYLAPPVVLFGFIASRVMRRIENRLVASLAFTLVAAASLLDARLSSDWARGEFFWPQLLMAMGLAGAFVGEIGLIAQQALDSGAVSSPINVMTYGSFFQGVRLFGGQLGVALMQHFIVVRSRYHTSMVGTSIQAGSYVTDDHLRALSGGFAPGASTTDELQARVVASVGSEVSKQVATLSYMDGFILIACSCVFVVLLYACMKPMRMYFAGR